MGLWSKLFGTKSTALDIVTAGPAVPVSSAGTSNRTGMGGPWFGWGSYSRVRTDYEWEQLFGENARLRNPIHAIAVDVSKVPKRVGRNVMLANRPKFEQIHGHAFEQLLKYPHPRLPWSKWAYVVTGFLRLLGQAPVRVTFDEYGPGAGQPICLTPFAPHQIVSPPNRTKNYWDVNWWGEYIQIPAGEVLHLYCPDLVDPFQALGMARALGDEANLDEAILAFLNAYHRNMAFLGAVVNAPGCDPEEMAKEWSREREGVLNAFKTLFINAADMKVMNLTPPLRELATAEGQRLNRDLMGQGFQVPPERMGILENANRSTIDAADFFQQSGNVEPDIIYFEEVFNQKLAPLYNEPGLCVKFENPVKETAQARLEQAKVGTTPGCWMTVNEARERHDLEPLPQGHKLAVPANNVMFIDANGDLVLPTQGEQQSATMQTLAAELATNQHTSHLWHRVSEGQPGNEAAAQVLTALLGAVSASASRKEG